MAVGVAIQADSYGEADSSSPIWTRCLRAERFDVREVNVFRADILEQVAGCAGFMWRFGHLTDHQQIARRLLPVLERDLGMVVYPDQRTAWHYDDKIAQAFLLEALHIPMPRTWVWFDQEAARQWASTADYPLVLKLARGAGSTNVRLIGCQKEANLWIDRLFGSGLHDLDESWIPPLKLGPRRIKRIFDLLLFGALPRSPGSHGLYRDHHKNYVLFQEFVAGNDFDTRVTVIGKRAFAFRRYNRPGDFRASGSGRLDHNPTKIDEDCIQLAFEVQRALGSQSVAIDFLRRDLNPVVAEVSYTYASWGVHNCPGHWDAELRWHEGSMWPEEAQIEDFICRLRMLPGG